MQKQLIIFLVFIVSSLYSWGQYQNVMISNVGQPEEPSIIINPHNPAQLMAGANIDHIYLSQDSGKSWVKKPVSSSYGVWGDPCLIVDTAGSFYFFHLSNPPAGNWIDRIVCQKLVHFDSSFTNGSYMGLHGTRAQDKEWAVVNPLNNEIYVTWTQFDDYGSSDPLDSSIIFFSKSVDGGQSWSSSRRISKFAGDCIDNDSTTEGAVPAVGPNGEIYVAWALGEHIYFNRSLDGGDHWYKQEKPIAPMPGGWTYDIPGISRCNGLPVTCCDISKGKGRGNIYVNWTDQRYGEEDTDVWFIRSTDGGESFSQALRVNDDPPGKHQFFSWMTIDQTNGDIYIVYYDRRRHADNATDVYLAYSKDQGRSFKNIRISESAFMPSSQVFFGDYTNISAHNGMIRPIWTRLDSLHLSIYTALIDAKDLAFDQLPPVVDLFTEVQAYPNPFFYQTQFAFKLHDDVEISLEVYDVMGRKIKTLLDQQRLYAGKYIYSFEAVKPTANGIYYFVLTSKDQRVVKKMIYNRNY